MRYYCYSLVVSIVTGLISAPLALYAATVEVAERSQPDGVISNHTTLVSTPVEYTTQKAAVESSGYRFTHWTINGMRHDDAFGRALNPERFTVYEPIDAVANYMSADVDVDADGIPDWFEILFYGDLRFDQDSDTDGDGLPLAEEYLFDFHPGLSNLCVSGGVSMHNSELKIVTLSGFVVYAERSEPDGLVLRSIAVSNGTVVTSQAVQSLTNNYAFVYWEVGGVRQSDAMGMSLSRFSMRITNQTEAVAWYLPADQDTVGDGIPDWWRLRYYGNLNVAAISDEDCDGMTLTEEYLYDTNPLIYDSFMSGGVSLRNSELTLVNLAGFYNWSIVSDPAGLLTAQSGVAQTGTVMVTSSLGNPITGYSFGYWSMNGVRQAGPSGMALSRLSFVVWTNMSVVANFFPTDEDTDVNGLPDWWEYRYFGLLNQNPVANILGNDLTIGDAYRYDCNPLISNTFMSGGVSVRNSESVLVNLQPFERSKYILREGILASWFTAWPTGQLGVASFGSPTAPALGDWDGDGDLDLFVATSNGTFHAYENTCSRYTPDLTEHPQVTAALASILSGLADPYLAFGDWSGDGHADLVAGAEAGKVRIISSTGHFNISQTPATVYDIDLGEGAGRILPALIDVTGDGLPDLLVLQKNGCVGVFAHGGDTGQPYGLPLWTNDLLGVGVPAATGISVADINHDGHKDLLVSDKSGRIWEFWRRLDGSFILMSKVWAGSGYGFAGILTLAAADLDGDGDSDAVAGFEQGGLMFLRDPRLGPPSNVRAVGGAGSVALSWEPDRQTRVKGYAVYRAAMREGPFTKLHDGLLPCSTYTDYNVVAGGTYYYYVSAATLAYFPGSTVGSPCESQPSEVVDALVGSVRLWMPDYKGDRGQTAVLKVNVDRAEGIAGQGLLIGIRYDPALLTPVSQINAQTQTVRRTAISENLVFSDNAFTANGEILITGQAGVALGAGCLLDVVFQVAQDATTDAMSTNVFTTVRLYEVGGRVLAVDSTDTAAFAVTAAYRYGDANGDGVLDMSDHQYLLWLLKKDTREPTPPELYACDMDGDGLLTQRDIPLLLRLIHGKTVNP